MFGLRHVFLSLVFQTWVLQQCSIILCLMIDNHLILPTNDCYTRISVGSKLRDVNIMLRTNVASLMECEENCSKNKHGCKAFSFGIGVKGNSTCLISSQIPTLQNLEEHPEYDVYAIKRQDLLRCDSDRSYRGLIRESENCSTKTNKSIRKGSTTYINKYPFSKFGIESMPLLVSQNALAFSRNKHDVTNYGRRGIYDLFINHDRHFHSHDTNHRFLDIIGSKNERILNNPFVIICHRKLQPGKKMMGLFIERIVNCENLQDCCRACDHERTFVCKGFNHRHRTDDSKCTCELTSTPYLRMDNTENFLVDSRYDYYGKIENCPSSIWHNDGILHWKDRIKSYRQSGQNTWFDLESTNKDFLRESSTDHSIYKESHSPNRKSDYDSSSISVQTDKQFHYEEINGFTSHYDNSNWNRNWKSPVSRYSDGIRHSTFPISHINHDKGNLDVKSAIFSDSRLDDHSVIQGFIIPNENKQYYGKFYNYGNPFSYNDNYVTTSKDTYFEKHETLKMTRKCSVKVVSGSKLSRSVLRKTCVAHDLEQCEEFCTNETSFSCESFAYRYNVLTTNPTDNCLLSDQSYQDINFYTDLEPNRDYDSYVLISDTKICYYKKSASRYPLEECFSRVRSGFTMPMDITRKSIFVNDFGECQFACTSLQKFVCRSFVFKYAMDNRRMHGHERVSSNCFLSDLPPEEINPIKMPDMDGAELYERNTFSFGCETYPSPFLISHMITPHKDKESLLKQMDEICYSEYHRPCKLMSHAVVSSMRTITKSDCRRKCSMMRNTGIIPCMSFNYIIINDNTRNNCFLSDISIRDLRPNLDYVRDNDHALYTWKEFDPYCNLNGNTRETINTPMFEEHSQLDPSMFNYPSTPRNLETGIHGSALERWRGKFRYEDHGYDFKHKSSNWDGKSPLDPDSFKYGLNPFYRNQIPPFRRYTVNGYPCKNGTVCQQNEITGFWSCEIENEHRNWDYCCDPSHQCGFSRGHHYPWCYVGSNEDQWRPCSETYHPYYFPVDHSIYRQSPIHTARHWPVIYFHKTSPPNCSASTNDPNINYS
ncbi:PREDICTED: uncharacterized protein LOC108554013 [Eufriesea mexicana]|uniref:uncharacterized protein LOC108554013 n=1 Tax=Eufriesea mexicana TaxID=516756 RepID=UPI00083BDE8B|nr:PREDICTED: uncharacterized protein LOC108554013 [Eufriesea mexicana]